MGEISYKLSDHAKQRMRERGIQEEWVARVLKSPYRLLKDQLHPLRMNASGFIYEKGNKVLCVVYDDSVDPWAVVTVYFEGR